MWERRRRRNPCRGITHSMGGEMSNLIFRGEDLLLGDHGQPNQTLGREMRGESHEGLGWILWLTLEQHMMAGSQHQPFPFLFSVSFHHSFTFVSEEKCFLESLRCDSNRSDTTEVIFWSACAEVSFFFFNLLRKGDKRSHFFRKVMDILWTGDNGGQWETQNKAIMWPITRLHLQNQAAKRHMKTIHGDLLGQSSGYHGVVTTETTTTADLFTNIDKILAQPVAK